MNIEKRNINDLIHADYNPRKKLQPSDTEYQKIKRSIDQFGYVDPVIINSDNTIIGGHQRATVLHDLGYTEIDVVVVDLDKAEEKALNIALNKISGEWDFEKLEDLLADSQHDIDLTLTGFEDAEINEMISRLETRGMNEAETEEDDYNTEEALEEITEPKTKPGDIYRLGNHKLMCGNSFDENKVEKLLSGSKCELTFTDPPYEMITKGGGILKNANSMKQIKENNVDTFEPANLVMYSDTNIYCHNKPLIKKYIELAEKNKQAYDLCFYKKLCTVPNYKGHLMTDCEYIAVIGNQDPNKGLEKELYSKCYIGRKDKDNKLSYSKPVGLCSKYIKLYGKSNILDLFGGSGSTLIACEQLGRSCYMMELDPKYCDVIIDRWEKFTGQKAEKVNGEEV